MAKEPTTFGLSSTKLVRLLQIAREVGQPQGQIDQQRVKTELLHDYLAQTLAVYRYAGEKLPAKQSQLRNTMNVLSGEPIGKLLQDPETDIDLIRMVKDFSTVLSKRTKSKAQHQVANTIYYAAIAHALLYHRRKITRYTYENLGKSFSKLAKENWIPRNLAGLFVKATEVSQEKAVEE